MLKSTFISSDAFKAMVQTLATATGMDSTQSVFLAEQLTEWRRALYKKRPALKLLTKFPISMNTPIGAETIKVPIIDFVGVAKIISSASTTIPRADATLTTITAEIKEVADSFGILLRELEQAAFSGQPLSEFRMKAALRGMEQGLNNILLYGNDENNLTGLLSPGSYFNKFANPSGAPWTMASDPNDIWADIAYLIMYSYNVSDGVENTRRVLFPTSYWSIIQTKKMGTLDQRTILQSMRETWPDIDFDSIPQTAAVTNPRTESGTVPVIIAFDHTDPEAAAFELPLMNQMLPPERKGLEWETIVRSLCAGVLSSRPKSLSIMDFPAA